MPLGSWSPVLTGRPTTSSPTSKSPESRCGTPAPAPGVEMHWGFKDEYFLLTIGPDAAAELAGADRRQRCKAALDDGSGKTGRHQTDQHDPLSRRGPADCRQAESASREQFDVPAFWMLPEWPIWNRSAASPASAPREWSIAPSPISRARPRDSSSCWPASHLTADELKPVPSTAVFAVALRLDPLKVYKKLIDLADKASIRKATNNSNRPQRAWRRPLAFVSRRTC